ncbi:MAG: DUF1983 domain-containing protein [Gammaproteobacteria bacterium]|nr:DUF1983 domain-containing protein [Gammaproteobacteria bacterium]
MFLDRVRETLSSDLLSRDDVREIIRDPGGPGDPNDPGGPVDPPTTPTGLFAIGQPGAIQVKWEAATYNGHNHTEVWASPIDDIRQGEAVGMAPGTSYIHAVGSEVGRYYWIRFVNRNGVAGPYNSQAGLYAKSLAFEFPEPPTGELDDSYLNDLLNERLAWLEDPTFGLRGEAARIRIEFNNLLDGALESIFNDLNTIREELQDALVTELFDETKGYAVGDLVIWLNPSTGTSYIYQCKQAIPEPVPPATAPLPSDTAYWNQVGDSAAIQAVVDDIAAAGLALQARGLYNGNGNVVGALAAALLNVRSVLEDGNGNLLSAGALLSLTSRVSTTEGKIEALATAMLEAGVLVDQDGVLVTSDAFLTLIARIETLSSNLLGNSEFMQEDKDTEDDWPNTPPEGWAVERNGTTATVGTNFRVRSSPRSGDGVRALFFSSGAPLTTGQSMLVKQAGLPVEADGYYQASVYVGSPLLAVRARVRITFDDAGATSFASPDVALTKTGLGPSAAVGTTLSDYNRIAVFAQAPEGATTATVSIEATPNTPNSAILYATRPFFGGAVADQTTPSPWVPGIQSNAYRAAAAAALALDLSYRQPDGPWAASNAFLQLKGQIDDTGNGLIATNAIALGVQSQINDPITGLTATANALDSLRTEVQSGPNSLTSLATRISGVAATIGNNTGNRLEDVAFSTLNYDVDDKDETVPVWIKTKTSGWSAATFGFNAAGYAIPRIAEKVVYFSSAGTPVGGAATLHQDVPVTSGQWYQFNAWTKTSKCSARLTLQFLTSAKAPVGTATSVIAPAAPGAGTVLSGYVRAHVAKDAPATAAFARVSLNAETATGSAPAAYFVRPLFGEATPDQLEPSPWLPPLVDAFAFQEMASDVYDDETGLGALSTLIQGVDSKVNDPATGLDAVAGAFNQLKASTVVVFENRLIRSEEFATGWGRTGVTVATDVGAVPGFEGTPAEAMREQATGGQHGLFQGSVPIEEGYNHVLSVYVKPVGGRHLVARAVAASSTGVTKGACHFTFNLSTGTIVGTDGVAGAFGWCDAVGGGWFRCWGAFKAPADSTQMQVAFFSSTSAANASGLPSFTGSTAAGLDLFGAQVNAGNRPDGYRKSTVSPVYGPIHDRLIATASAIAAVDAEINDPATGLPFLSGAYSTLNAYAGPGGTLATMVNGLQAGVGRGGNHVPNSEFDSAAHGWTHQNPSSYQLLDAAVSDPIWSVGGDPLPVTGLIMYPSATVANGPYSEIKTSPFAVVAGKFYEVSVYFGAHRCYGSVGVYWLGTTGGLVGANMTPLTTGAQVPGPTGGRAQLSSFKRAFGVFKAPTGASTAIFFVRSTPLSTSQVNSCLFFLKPFMGVATEGQTTPSEYAVGLEPKIFAALKEEGLVWADKEGAGATYTMKLRARDEDGGAETGFGMAAVKENGVWISDVRFNANRFAIMNPAYPNGAKKYPFIVEGGKVYIDTAIIKTASIGTLLLGENAVTVPTYVENVYDIFSNGNWVVMGGLAATVSNPMSWAMPVLIQFSARQDYLRFFPDQLGPGTGLAIRQSNNGAAGYVISSPAGQLNIPLCVQYNDYLVWTCKATVPANTTTTFTPEWFSQNNDVKLRQKSMLVLGVKR